MWLVFLKEVKEVMRDRKTLFFMIAMPLLLFPAIFGATTYFSGKAFKQAESKVLKYALINPQAAPELSEALLTTEGFEYVADVPQTDPAALVKSQQVDFVLAIPEDFAQSASAQKQSTLTLYFNDAELNFVFNRTEEIVNELSKRYRAQALLALGVAEKQQAAILKPIVLEQQNVADKRENWGEKIGGFIPYLLLFSCLMGAIPVATDIAAGEKERGTLETLLLAPLTRKDLVLGKFNTVAFAGVVSALITVSSMVIWGLILGQGMAVKFVADFMQQISMLDFVLMFLMLVPVVAIFAALLMSLSIYARSYKEAQSYMGFIPILAIVPIMLALLPGVKLQDGWAWMPITNVSLAIKELVKGTMDYFQLVGIFASSALIAAALIAFCVYWFSQEKVLFR